VKISAAQGTNKIQGDSSGSKFFIADDPEVHSKLGELLRDMYQNPVWAVAREYTANALDADIDKPIEVALPSRECCEFVVKDFGPGLDKEDMRSLLTGYGMSDKRGDPRRIGGFGIGAKCGLAYTNTFTYGSVYIDPESGKKRKTVLMAFLDENLEAKANVTADLDLPVDDDSPTGITVVVPVKAEDIGRFQRSVYNFTLSRAVAPRIKVVSRNMIGLMSKDKGFEPIATAFNREVQVANHKLNVGLVSSTSDLRNTDIQSQGRLIVVMSGVPYPVSYADVFNTLTTKEFSCNAFLSMSAGSLPCMVIEADGTTDMVPTPSRETIKMSMVGASFIANALHAYSDLICAEYAKDPKAFMEASEGISDWSATKAILAGFHNRLRNAINCKPQQWKEKVYAKLVKDSRFIPVGVTSDFERGVTLSKGYLVVVGRKKGQLQATPSQAHGVNLGNTTKFHIIRLKDIPTYALRYYKNSLKHFGVTDDTGAVIKPMPADWNTSDCLVEASLSLLHKSVKAWIREGAKGRYWYRDSQETRVVLLEMPGPDISNGLVRCPTLVHEMDKLMPKDRLYEFSSSLAWPATLPVVVRASTGGSKAGPKVKQPSVRSRYIHLEFRGDGALPHFHLVQTPSSVTREYNVSSILDIRTYGTADGEKLTKGLGQLIYFIEHGKYKEKVDQADCTADISAVERLTPSFYSKRLVAGCKNPNRKELWPCFYAAVNKYVKTRPKEVQEWLYTQPYLADFYSDVNGLSTLTPGNTHFRVAYTAFVMDILKLKIVNKDVKDFVYLTSNPDYVRIARKNATGELFTQLDATDIWLGSLAYDCGYFGYLFRDNDEPTNSTPSIRCEGAFNFKNLPAKRAAAKALGTLITNKHPFIYGLNACAGSVESSIENYGFGGGAKLKTAFINEEVAVMSSVTKFIADYK